MKKLKSIAALAALMVAVATSGCASNKENRFASSELKPSRTPRDMPLFAKAEPVLLLTLQADNTGYTIVSATQTNGVPTSPIDTDRDVVISALNAAGRPVSAVSIFNPRQVRTTGAKNPATAVLDRATFTVVFPKPSQIQTIHILVRSGPNEKLDTKLPVPKR